MPLIVEHYLMVYLLELELNLIETQLNCARPVYTGNTLHK
jgi:hypothetical protein